MKRKNLPPKKARLAARQDSQENRNLAFNWSLKYLSFRVRSTKEIRDYLARKNFIEATIDAVVEKLNELKFLNDEEFAKAWIESRQKNKGKSKFVLKNELRLKGLNNELIEQVLKEAQEDFETAGILFERKKDKMKGLSPEEFKKKMGSFLQRRGYSWNIIGRLLENS